MPSPEGQRNCHPPSPFYYGCLSSDGQPFLIDRATFDNLAVDVLAEP